MPWIEEPFAGDQCPSYPLTGVASCAGFSSAHFCIGGVTATLGFGFHPLLEPVHTPVTCIERGLCSE